MGDHDKGFGPPSQEFAELWARIRANDDEAELNQFAISFPGTLEGYDARKRSDELRQQHNEDNAAKNRAFRTSSELAEELNAIRIEFKVNVKGLQEDGSMFAQPSLAPSWLARAENKLASLRNRSTVLIKRLQLLVQDPNYVDQFSDVPGEGSIVDRVAAALARSERRLEEAVAEFRAEAEKRKSSSGCAAVLVIVTLLPLLTLLSR